MDRNSTGHLMDVLKNAEKADLDPFSRQYLGVECGGFPAYMDEIISRKDLKRRDIFQKADLPAKYGYKLLTGEAHTSDRDKLLRLFISMRMNLKETQRALELYGLAPLYPRKKRGRRAHCRHQQEPPRRGRSQRVAGGKRRSRTFPQSRLNFP